MIELSDDYSPETMAAYDAARDAIRNSLTTYDLDNDDIIGNYIMTCVRLISVAVAAAFLAAKVEDDSPDYLVKTIKAMVNQRIDAEIDAGLARKDA